jgi:hypothetical protein
MKTQRNDPEAQCRKLLAPLVNKLVHATPEQRCLAVPGILAATIPTSLRLLVELLVARLGYKDERVCEGTADTLRTLGPSTLPALELSVLRKPPERILLRLAPIIAELGRGLTPDERFKLHTSLMVAAVRARSFPCRMALEVTANHLLRFSEVAPVPSEAVVPGIHEPRITPPMSRRPERVG